MGNLENRTKLEPNQLHQRLGSGGCEDLIKTDLNTISARGILADIVLRGWESQPQGEGSDGNTQPAKETYAGHAGSDQHKPTSLRGITTGSCNG